MSSVFGLRLSVGPARTTGANGPATGDHEPINSQARVVGTEVEVEKSDGTVSSNGER